MGTLLGKRALVTAGGQGIGKAIAESLLEAGCDLAIHYHSDQQGAQEVAARAARLGRRAILLQADLTREAAATAMVGEAAAFLGGLDVLINNAGGTSLRGARLATSTRLSGRRSSIST